MESLRPVLAIVGAVLLILGALLTFYPLASGGTVAGGGEVTAKGLIAPQFMTVSYTGGDANTYLLVVDCGANAPSLSPSVSPSSICTGQTTLATVTGGASGSASVNAPSGDNVVVITFDGTPGGSSTFNGNTQISLQETIGIIGMPLFLVGVLLLVLGIALKKKPKKPKAGEMPPPGAWPQQGDPNQGYYVQPGAPQGYYPPQGDPGYYPQQGGAPPQWGPPPQQPY